MKTVIFTGAGASRPLGFPTTTEFFGTPEKGPAWTPNNPKAFQAIQNTLRSNPLDVEDALRLLEPSISYVETDSGKYLSKFLELRVGGSFEQHFQELKLLHDQIIRRCFDLYAFRPSTKIIQKLYFPLLEILHWQKNVIEIFTTNYDRSTNILCEIAFDNDLQAYDGFDFFERFRPADYEKITRGIAVYRLHGSMLWVKDENEIRQKPTISHTNEDHLFLAPGYKGNPEDEHEVYAFPHQKLRDSLRKAQNIVVIGFTFRDPRLNDIFDEALSQNERLRMASINPETPDQRESGWQLLQESYGERITPIQMKFGEPNTIKEIRSWLRTHVTVN